MMSVRPTDTAPSFPFPSYQYLITILSLLLLAAGIGTVALFDDSSVIPPAAPTGLTFMALGASLLAHASPHASTARWQAESAGGFKLSPARCRTVTGKGRSMAHGRGKDVK